jgi:hypothetical protein
LKTNLFYFEKINPSLLSSGVPFWIIGGVIYLDEKRHLIKKGFQDGENGVYDYPPSKKVVTFLETSIFP